MAGTLREMGALLRAVPGPDATDAEVAEWYERKAALFEHIAEEPGADVATVRRFARQAHEHADALTDLPEVA